MLRTVALSGVSPPMSAVEQIDVEMTIVVGAAEMPLAAAMALGRGAVIPLGRNAEEPVSIVANGRKIADGKVKIIGDRIAVVVTG